MRGLPAGEKVDPTPKLPLFPSRGLRYPAGLSKPEKLLLLPVDPDMDGVREYRGGVLYTDPGVGGADEGPRPRSFRWPGVRGMSERSSFGRTSGNRATPILNSGMHKKIL